MTTSVEHSTKSIERDSNECDQPCEKQLWEQQALVRGSPASQADHPSLY